MDFTTVSEKIAGYSYESVEEFHYDMKLISRNCMTYNLPETVYHKAALKLEKFVETLIAGLMLNLSGIKIENGMWDMPLARELDIFGNK
jgi:histone acetyltransferase